MSTRPRLSSILNPNSHSHALCNLCYWHGSSCWGRWLGTLRRSYCRAVWCGSRECLYLFKLNFKNFSVTSLSDFWVTGHVGLMAATLWLLLYVFDVEYLFWVVPVFFLLMVQQLIWFWCVCERWAQGPSILPSCLQSSWLPYWEYTDIEYCQYH